MCRNLWRYNYSNFASPPMYGTRFREWLLPPNHTFRLSKLTNRPQFSTVYTLIDHRNDGFTAKSWTFYGVISMVYTTVDHGKLWSICFFTITFSFFSRKTKPYPPPPQKKREKKNGTTWHVTSFPWSTLSQTIALDQSAPEDTLSYCKK